MHYTLWDDLQGVRFCAAIVIKMKFARKLVCPLLLVCLTLSTYASVEAQLAKVAWKAAQQLTKERRNEVKYNDEGFVTEVVISNFPSGFMMGQLEVFPKLESVTISSRYYFEDSNMGGVRKLKNLKSFAIRKSRYASGTCLELLAEVPALESLEIKSCSEIESLQEVSRIRQLKTLKLDSSEAVSLAPLLECRNLKAIELVRSSNVDDAAMKILGEIKTLESIDLSYTSVTDEGLAELAKLPNLVELNLKHCQSITGESFADFASPHPLKELNLRDAVKLTDKGLNELARFKGLENLLLQGNKEVTGDGFQFLADLKKLKLFSCPGTSVRDEHLKLMTGIETLEVIWLPNCEAVSGRGLECLTSSQSVIRISLNECPKIDSPDFEVLAKFGNLDELYIAKTRIRNDGIEKLCELKKLRILDISDNIWLGDPAFEKLQDSSVSKLIASGLRRLTNESFSSALKMKKLENLTVTANKKLDGSGLQMLVGNTSLKSLTIEQPEHLSIEAFGFIRQIPKIEELSFSEGEIRISQIEQLAGMPNLRKFNYKIFGNGARSEQLNAVLESFPKL